VRDVLFVDHGEEWEGRLTYDDLRSLTVGAVAWPEAEAVGAPLVPLAERP
jgi:hypothetical protein